jgi:hypothetical protein
MLIILPPAAPPILCSAALLAALAIAPVCAERIKVFDERRVKSFRALIISICSVDTCRWRKDPKNEPSKALIAYGRITTCKPLPTK